MSDELRNGLVIFCGVFLILALIIFGVGHVNNKIIQTKMDGYRDCAAIIAEGINDFARAPIDIMEWQVRKQKEMLEEAVNDPKPGPRG